MAPPASHAGAALVRLPPRRAPSSLPQQASRVAVRATKDSDGFRRLVSEKPEWPAPAPAKREGLDGFGREASNGEEDGQVQGELAPWSVLNQLGVEAELTLVALLERAPGQGGGAAVEKDPIKLWDRYVEWLYQHKQLGLFVDVSRMGFTDDFLLQMEPLMQRAFVAMGELEKGAIANPDEGRMVGHYWLRDPGLAPNSFLRTKIEKTVDHILAFSQDVVSGKLQRPF
ncbi:Glucose-6-phosphate isomerase [Triticum urartu]|uniref:Glucose-6-phosphate isomerase n=1 Tax=Triticum urartu TaxID=4572 RepID=M7Z7H8_TRIUA|nr:Glucose-6-phosphate isomerase [Triticum urartu]